MYSVFSHWDSQGQSKAREWFTGVELEFGVKASHRKIGLSKLTSIAANAVAPCIAVQSSDDIAVSRINNQQAYTFVREWTGSGFELISPKMSGAADRLKNLHAIVQGVKNTDGVNLMIGPTDGIHVHVDAESLTVKQILSVVKNFSTHQAFLYDLLKVKKERRRFCKPLPIRAVNTLLEQGPETTRELLRLLSPEPSASERFFGLNLFSIQKHKTLEFRLFNASFDPETINFFHDLALAFVIKSVETSNTNANSAPLSRADFFPAKNLEQAGNEFFHFLGVHPPWQNDMFSAGRSNSPVRLPLIAKKDGATYVAISASIRTELHLLRPGTSTGKESGLLVESTMTTDDARSFDGWETELSVPQPSSSAVLRLPTLKRKLEVAFAVHAQNEAQPAARRSR